MSESPAPEHAVAPGDRQLACPRPARRSPRPRPKAGSLGSFASGMGNASFARSLGGGGSTVARSPAAGAATPPADGVTAAAGLPDVEGGGGVAAVPAGPTEPGGA